MPIDTTADQLHVALLAPEIPWNTGNIGRTCLAAGVRLHLIEPLGFSLDGSQVRRAGLDYWPRVAPCLWSDWHTFADQLPALGEPLFFTAEAERSLWEVRCDRPTVMIFGGESQGLPAAVRERYSERLVSLPQSSPHVRSLNLSSCVAVAVYEALRQRSASAACRGRVSR